MNRFMLVRSVNAECVSHTDRDGDAKLVYWFAWDSLQGLLVLEKVYIRRQLQAFRGLVVNELITLVIWQFDVPPCPMAASSSSTLEP